MGRPGVQGMLERRGTHALRSGVGGLQHFSDRHTRIRADSPMRRHGRGGRGARRARRAAGAARAEHEAQRGVVAREHEARDAPLVERRVPGHGHVVPRLRAARRPA